MIQRPLNKDVSQADSCQTQSRQLLVMHNLGECTTPLVCMYNPVQADSCQSRQLLVMCNLGECTTPCVLVFQVARIHDPAQDPQG